MSDNILDFRSLHHIFAKCKSKIIHNHYKAVIMDKAPYEFDAIFLNRLSDIACLTAVTDITCFGHYILHSNIFVEKSVSLWI